MLFERVVKYFNSYSCGDLISKDEYYRKISPRGRYRTKILNSYAYYLCCSGFLYPYKSARVYKKIKRIPSKIKINDLRKIHNEISLTYKDIILSRLIKVINKYEIGSIRSTSKILLKINRKNNIYISNFKDEFSHVINRLIKTGYVSKMMYSDSVEILHIIPPITFYDLDQLSKNNDPLQSLFIDFKYKLIEYEEKNGSRGNS